MGETIQSSVVRDWGREGWLSEVQRVIRAVRLVTNRGTLMQIVDLG